MNGRMSSKVRQRNDIDFIEVNKAHKMEYIDICEKLSALEERRDTAPEEEQTALAVRIRRLTRRRISVENEFIDNNLGLAKSHADRYRTVYPDSRFDEDYHAAACFALWEAFLRWDPETAAFSTYARMWIEGQIRKEVCVNEFPQLSYPDFKARLKVLGMRDSIAEHDGPSAVTNDRISKDTGLTVGVVERVLRPQAMRLDRKVGPDDSPDGDTFADLRLSDVEDEDEDVLDAFELSPDAARRVLSSLSPAESWVLVRAHGLDGGPPHPMFWIAGMLGITVAEVKEVYSRALESVKETWGGLSSPDSSGETE